MKKSYDKILEIEKEVLSIGEKLSKILDYLNELKKEEFVKGLQKEYESLEVPKSTPGVNPVVTVYGCPSTYPVNYPNVFKDYSDYILNTSTHGTGDENAETTITI